MKRQNAAEIGKFVKLSVLLVGADSAARVNETMCSTCPFRPPVNEFVGLTFNFHILDKEMFFHHLEKEGGSFICHSTAHQPEKGLEMSGGGMSKICDEDLKSCHRRCRGVELFRQGLAGVNYCRGDGRILQHFMKSTKS